MYMFTESSYLCHIIFVMFKISWRNYIVTKFGLNWDILVAVKGKGLFLMWKNDYAYIPPCDCQYPLLSFHSNNLHSCTLM